MVEDRSYETVIGLEIHAELRTATKIFCACPTTFGAEPNTQCCPVCAGLPGAMPVLNRKAVELAVTAGLALHCGISGICRMDRKQYMYPDLPKAYQISQEDHPVCKNGWMEIHVKDGKRKIGISRIHLEEDAGKLMHGENGTRVDCNRCGVPLIEIVTLPDLRSGEEAAAFLKELRAILLACGVSDCKMQEGSLRCDVNVSVRPTGSTEMGERTEIKNLNSFAFVEKAVNTEAERQIRELQSTGTLRRRTMRYLPETGETVPMREKESLRDYRFFPEPDLPPFRISDATVERLRRELPELPAAKRERLRSVYGISAEEAIVLTAVTGLPEFFEQTAGVCRYPRLALSMLLTDLLRLCGQEPFSSPVSPERLAELADLFGDRMINSTTAKKLLNRIAECDGSPAEIAKREDLMLIRDEKRITAWIGEIFKEEARAVADYRGGKKNAIRALQGKLMAKSGGRADPVLAGELLTNALDREDKN